jgi:hypothetical protein
VFRAFTGSALRAVLWGAIVLQPAPTPVGGPITVVAKNATLSSSGSQVYTNLGATQADLVYTVGTVTGTISFTLTQVDPQNTATAISGDTAPVSSGSVSSGTSSAISLSPLHSSALQVSWTVGGGSTTGVFLTLRNTLP